MSYAKCQRFESSEKNHRLFTLHGSVEFAMNVLNELSHNSFFVSTADHMTQPVALFCCRMSWTWHKLMICCISKIPSGQFVHVQLVLGKGQVLWSPWRVQWEVLACSYRWNLEQLLIDMWFEKWSDIQYFSSFLNTRAFPNSIHNYWPVK